MPFAHALATATALPPAPAETATAVPVAAIWGALFLLAIVFLGAAWAGRR